jgi:hypothetical protein
MPEIIYHSSCHGRPRRGIALLAVLFVIMAITVLSLGFLTRTSTELACGQNMALRIETDQLAASGLEHARGLILNPQDVGTEYWTGGTGLQLASGGSEAYDVAVAPVVSNPNDHCTYSITSDAYQTQGGERIGRSIMSAQLRLDPAVALWTGAATTLTSGLALYGDVRCGGNLINYGSINGDVFANSLAGTGTKTGRQETLAQLSLAWPAVTVSGFTSRYNTDTLSSGTLSIGTYGPYDPAHVLYRHGDLNVQNNTTINAMLLVEGNLTIRGNANSITAPKNLPALYVTGDLIIRNISALNINGLVIVGGSVFLGAGATGVNVRGALFVGNTIVETTADAFDNDPYSRVYGAPVWHPAGGQINGGLQFDGVDDYVQSPDADAPFLDEYTLSLWMNADAVQLASAAILSRCSSDGSVSYWTLQFNSSTPRELVLRDMWGFSWSTGIKVTDVQDGWHYVCIVCHNVALGQHLTSYVGYTVKNDGDTWWGQLGGGYGHLNIGTNRIASADRMYKGYLDDVRIFSQALLGPQIQTLSTGQFTGVPNPAWAWSFDASGASLTTSADPEKAALVTWPGGSRTNWSPAASAFFKQISKVTP